MNQDLGTVVTAMITDENDKAYFVQKSGVTYRLDKSETPEALEIGDTVRGFLYESMNKEKRMTTILPKSQVGHFGWGVVTNVRKDLGVFVDIGLSDKEMVVSLDELSEIKSLWPKKGDQLMISLRVDEKDRIWGELADEHVFRSLARIPKDEEEWKNKEITGIVYRLKMVGTFMLTEDYYIGFIHPTEREVEPRLGETVTGRVIGVSPHGMLNVSLKPRAHEALEEDAQMILTLLQQSPTNSLPYYDKSDPEEIRNYFGISKAQFKRAVGRLMKEKLAYQEDGFTKLRKK
ncbi:S1 RNA-binding domain-containing protein [Jeotgalibaca caeni]|uniref:CvfB family protein n=1 Tax=Jeotgalibaca caeni TaxID=3028623 RepID=UPI00237DD178|nr:S1-like domain-containing RNA-binding protein [Jeotgalibaca caeni]MDE1549382.1 S1-like domain-containing RNA-binding protein [Jeotgalibaca caeni]